MQTLSSREITGDIYCSDISKKLGEPMVGTAGKAWVWLLLEYPATWGAKALPESALPNSVKERLTSFQEMVPDSRIELIKGQFSAYPRKIALYVIVSAEIQPKAYRFELAHYEDVLEIDLAAILNAAPEYQGFATSDPLYLVCTNGRRDRCCAKAGLVVYSALARILEGNVWQCTHVGGHRFAANVLYFPEGIYYGRVNHAEAERIVDAHDQGEIYLEKLRGRSCYPGVVQAAEYFLRRESRERRFSAFQLDTFEEKSAGRWIAGFRGRLDGFHHIVELDRHPTGYSVYESCRTLKQAAGVEYSLVKYRATERRS